MHGCCCCCLFLFFIFADRISLCSPTDLKLLMILLLQPPDYWNCWHAPHHIWFSSFASDESGVVALLVPWSFWLGDSDIKKLAMLYFLGSSLLKSGLPNTCYWVLDCLLLLKLNSRFFPTHNKELNEKTKKQWQTI